MNSELEQKLNQILANQVVIYKRLEDIEQNQAQLWKQLSYKILGSGSI